MLYATGGLYRYEDFSEKKKKKPFYLLLKKITSHKRKSVYN